MALVEQLPRAVRLRKHRALPENRAGRDFFVGDLHGSRELLERKLAAKGFDRKTDRVMAVGDLVDRGPDSFGTLALVHEPWFHSVLGNHELMWLEALSGNARAQMNVAINGGDELLTALAREQGEVILGHVAAALEKMPFAFTVAVGDARIGVTHAEPPEDWLQLEDTPLAEWQRLVWVRDRFMPRAVAANPTVPNIDVIAVGHTPGERLRRAGNVVCVDTGACMTGGDLTVLEAGELLAEVGYSR